MKRFVTLALLATATTASAAPPTDAELSRFRTWLAPLKQPIVRRYSGGKDVMGACGMLASIH